ncbi:MAG: CheY-like chemotaxis protein [Crocinitomix sp.]|jgi:CheY-like chemotaxis protein
MNPTKKLLIVDDDERNIFALSAVLRSFNFEIETAYDGKMAYEILTKENNIDIVLMDIMMPVMDGYEAIRLIRQNDTLKDLPIIALTANAMKGDKEKCINAGANDYCSKPVDINVLLEKIQELK